MSDTESNETPEPVWPAEQGSTPIVTWTGSGDDMKASQGEYGDQ